MQRKLGLANKVRIDRGLHRREQTAIHKTGIITTRENGLRVSIAISVKFGER